MKNIAVIGAGTMGNGIAHVFAQFGHTVTLIDVSQDALDKAKATITKNLDRQVSKGSLSEEEKLDTLSNITTDTSIENGVKNVQLVVEAATENIELKLKIFNELDRVCAPEVILASNTSSISITKIARGYSTSDEVTALIMDTSRKLNKVPVEVNDYPGFVANRILMPMINEAIYTLYEGVAGVEEIDTVMKLGMAHPMGPLQLADFIGLDVCLAIMKVLHEGFGNPKYAPCPLLVNMVTAGKKGVKSGEGFYSWTHGTKELVVAANFS
jgi:3-hydroxybutyryl-CoA dehydrogenase